ncbi:ABC transporter permease [Streptomyces sp. MP131-18]|uniref:ABC transporter permease n=1 Tax=Streptomyces sp. MP131-18 TaxID=1857892 RepID=UPI00097CAE65|nr:ABC transporter permease [Streptomyces sp. MP131-18]ONK14893.1 ABC transporter efflux protein, DrrB family [Streptomyces sp. MP131-18]
MTDTSTTESPTTTAPAALAPASSDRRPTARAAVLRAETRLFLREPANLFWICVFPTLLMSILGCVPAFREADEDLGGQRLIDAYVPVAVLIAVIVASIQAMPPILTTYREMGILRRMSTTPVRPSSLLSAQMGLNGVTGLLSALLALVVGRLAFDVALPDQLAAYALTLLLATAACLAIGALVAALAGNSKHALGIGSVVFFPALFCIGVWIPVQTMPEVLANIVEFTPFGAAANALNQAAAGDWPDWSHLGTLAAWATVLTAAAIRWFRWK